MLMKANSRALRVLLIIANPTERLPSLLPLWIEPARVGQDYTTYVNVTLRRK